MIHCKLMKKVKTVARPTEFLRLTASFIRPRFESRDPIFARCAVLYIRGNHFSARLTPFSPSSTPPPKFKGLLSLPATSRTLSQRVHRHVTPHSSTKFANEKTASWILISFTISFLRFLNSLNVSTSRIRRMMVKSKYAVHSVYPDAVLPVPEFDELYLWRRKKGSFDPVSEDYLVEDGRGGRSWKGALRT